MGVYISWNVFTSPTPQKPLDISGEPATIVVMKLRLTILRRLRDAMWGYPVTCPDCGVVWESYVGFAFRDREISRGCRCVNAEVIRVFRPWRWVKGLGR